MIKLVKKFTDHNNFTLTFLAAEAGLEPTSTVINSHPYYRTSTIPHRLAPQARIELATTRLTVVRSTAELLWSIICSHFLRKKWGKLPTRLFPSPTALRRLLIDPIVSAT